MKLMSEKEKKKKSEIAMYRKEYYLKNRKSILKKLKEKYRKDKTFREKVKKYYSDKYQTDNEYYIATLEAARNRYHTDPEYRRKTIERAKKRHALKRKQKKIRHKK
jgi:hypothetical protein